MTVLSKIKGIGPKSLMYLRNVNVKSIEDLLTYYPYKYNVVKFDDIKSLKDGENVLVNCNVDSYALLRRFNGTMSGLTFRAGINGKTVNVIIFNRTFLKSSLTLGRNINVYGKYSESNNTIVANDIKFEKIYEGTIIPVYHLTRGINQKTISKYITSAFEQNIKIDDNIPDYLNEKYHFIDKESAVKKMHMPKDIKDIKDAKLKLIYEEFFEFMFKINYLKKFNKSDKKDKVRNVSIIQIDDFIRNIPFELTSDQNNSVKEIFQDMTSSNRMNRMLQGDVGSGKTVVSVIAVYINYLSKSQSALMAPTEILALQHYETIKNLFMGSDITVELLLGSTKKADKDRIYENLEKGKIDLLIGTHALISEKVKFKNLGLVITDEQHRFGVKQRSELTSKGTMPDTLYMSATPIPRSYALTLYGDMDISYIKTKPAGRKEIETVIKSEKSIKEVLSLMLDEIKKGHQVYVICPLIEESENSDLTTIKALKENIDLAYNKKIKTEILHGKLAKDVKEQVMEDFKTGKTNILISTTVVEVGVDIRNATMMVIFDAERFGLATLHQLRGRIGRNNFDCKCILMGSKSNKRLKTLCESNDGFYITEKDFEMRGEGDLFGVKQSGDMSFKVASIKENYKVLVQARDDSNEFIEKNIKSDFINYKNYSKMVMDLTKLD